MSCKLPGFESLVVVQYRGPFALGPSANLEMSIAEGWSFETLRRSFYAQDVRRLNVEP